MAMKNTSPWPAWTEANGEHFPDQLEIKKLIAAEYGEESLTKSWLKVCAALEGVTAEIASKGSAAIPVLSFQDFQNMSSEQKEKLKDIGTFVVRQVIEEEQARGYFEDLKSYVKENEDHIYYWPAETPIMYRLFYTPTQMAARSHPNQLAVSRELNSWWHDATNATSPDPLSYADAFRIRRPGTKFMGLGYHIDAGSLSRWGDADYRRVYSKVWEGMPEEHDPYDMTLRQHANQAMYKGRAHSTVLRSFQGWTALSDAGPGHGSLLVYPNVKLVMAYLLLRPFFRQPENEADIMDASKWTFDADSDWFPGTFRADSQRLSPYSHPHLRLEECCVHIPEMKPGDTVWWHGDMCHAVDVEHTGKTDASVVYVAATPTTPQNKKYIKEQLDSFLNGEAPTDFTDSLKMEKEGSLKGFLGEKGILSEEGRKAMGFGIVV